MSQDRLQEAFFKKKPFCHPAQDNCGWVAKSRSRDRSPPWDPSFGSGTATGHLAQVHTFQAEPKHFFFFFFFFSALLDVSPKKKKTKKKRDDIKEPGEQIPSRNTGGLHLPATNAVPPQTSWEQLKQPRTSKPSPHITGLGRSSLLAQVSCRAFQRPGRIIAHRNGPSPGGAQNELCPQGRGAAKPPRVGAVRESTQR